MLRKFKEAKKAKDAKKAAKKEAKKKDIKKDVKKKDAKSKAKGVKKDVKKIVKKIDKKPVKNVKEVKKNVKPVKEVKGSKKEVKVKETVVELVKKPASSSDGVVLPPKYDPEKDKGAFMNPVMLEYFRQQLIKWRSELLRESQETIQKTLQGTELQQPDIADRASAETDHALELRTRDRERKLIAKINSTLERIAHGDDYGYCEETGEPITIARLKARPIATLSIEAQERHERMEKTHRDD